MLLVEAPWATPRCSSLRDLYLQHRRHVVCLFRQQQMKVQLVTQRCTAPRISGTTSSAEMHNVLDPYGTSVDVAGRCAERRGPKTCLQKSRTNLSQVSCRHSWGSSSRSLLAFVCVLGMSATIPCAAVTCDYHVKVCPRTHEQLRDKKTLCCALTSWSTVSHMAGGTSCTFVMLAQSAFPLCRPIRGVLYCWCE